MMEDTAEVIHQVHTWFCSGISARPIPLCQNFLRSRERDEVSSQTLPLSLLCGDGCNINIMFRFTSVSILGFSAGLVNLWSYLYSNWEIPLDLYLEQRISQWKARLAVRCGRCSRQSVMARVERIITVLSYHIQKNYCLHSINYTLTK